MKELIGEEYLGSPQKELWEKMTAAAVYGIGFPLEKFFAHILPHETGNDPYFAQERYGDPNADPFFVEKLVTLIGAITNGSSETGMNHDRAGKCGKWARKLRADELRQLKQVLKGIMALIGPRPVTETDIKKYYAAIEELSATEHTKQGLRLDWEDARRIAKPGVMANWSPSQYEEDYVLDPFTVVINDIYYAQNASLRMDLAIINQLATAASRAAGRAALRGVSASFTAYQELAKLAEPVPFTEEPTQPTLLI